MQRKSKIGLGSLALAVVMGATGALSATRSWLPASGTGDWFDPLNWDGATTVPQAGDDVVINTAGTVLLTNSTPALTSFCLVGTLTFSGWDTVLDATNVTVSSGGVLTLPGPYENETPLHRVQIECENFTLEDGASINLASMGHAGKAKASGFGPGKGFYSGAIRQGAGHGGLGIPLNGVYLYGSPYGDPIEPVLPGSSGGAQWTARGGHGGGTVFIDASGRVQIDGVINVAGGAGVNADGSYSGGGAGGSVNIHCATFTGASSGLIDASGGTTPDKNNGSGGRIAVHYDVTEQAMLAIPQVTFRAKSGNVLRADSMGSLYLSDGSWVSAPFERFEGVWFHGEWANDWTFAGNLVPVNSIGFGAPSGQIDVAGDVILDGVCLGVSGGSELRCKDIVLSNGGSMSVLSAYVPLPATALTTTQHGSLVEASGTISLAPGSWMYPFTFFRPHEGIANTNGLAALFKASHILIATNAGFIADGTGSPGGVYTANPWGNGNGNASGRGLGTRDSYGASHGGLGVLAPEMRRYGSAFAPVFPGSGGGAGYRNPGSSGGGAIRLQASGIVEINGMLTADALPHNGDAKGGSGGSVFVLAGSFRGSASAIMRARGQSSSYKNDHGGGGRIAIGIGLNDAEIAGLFSGASHDKMIVSTNDVHYAGTVNVDAGGDTAEAGTIQFMTKIRGTTLMVR